MQKLIVFGCPSIASKLWQRMDLRSAFQLAVWKDYYGKQTDKVPLRIHAIKIYLGRVVNFREKKNYFREPHV